MRVQIVEMTCFDASVVAAASVCARQCGANASRFAEKAYGVSCRVVSQILADESVVACVGGGLAGVLSMVTGGVRALAVEEIL